MRYVVDLHLLDIYFSAWLGAGWIGSSVYLDVLTWNRASILLISEALKGGGLWREWVVAQGPQTFDVLFEIY